MYFDQFGFDPFGGAQDYYAQMYAPLYWTIGLSIFACVVGIILNFTFLRRSNEGRFKGFWGKVYNLFSFNRFYSEGILKLLNVVSFMLITVLGIYMVCTGSIVWGILLIVFGNLAARLLYEITIMFIILTRKTVSIDRRMSGIEKFYSDDMKDWEETDSVEEAFGEDDHEEEVREGELTFADRLKEAFGEPDGMKYGYDDECKECENWDEISEDCYCEDDCLTCEKPDQDKVKETAEAVAKVAEEAVAETVEEHEAAPAEEPSAEEPAEAPETPTEPVNPEA